MEKFKPKFKISNRIAADPGKYRKIQNYVANAATGEIIYTPPPPQDVPAMMKGLVEWLNGEHEVHPILIGGIAQFQLVHIHPFRDVNGQVIQLEEVKEKGEQAIRCDVLNEDITT